ncbi:MAG TPA: GDP-L-fucose synthase [Gemmataceae bacterium]|nr:GDP-L-fucose synthase [Gemmataceae bacterium]
MAPIKTYIAGHRGLVGSALLRRYQTDASRTLVTRSHAELDLTNTQAVDRFFAAERPDEVLLAAAKVGGILANNEFPVDFMLSNLQIQINVLTASHHHGVRKLLFLGSSCIYPRLAPQPLREEYLLDGKLEPTNEPYAIAKIAGIKLAQSYRRQFGCNFISVMPTNLYGPNDNFSLQSSHVLPALIRKFHDAKIAGAPSVTLWGTGNPRREFLHVDDLADACQLLMRDYDSGDIINIGCGEDLTIRELAQSIADVVGFRGEIEWDVSKPDGTPRKLLDVSRLRALGWQPKITLADGIRQTYAWFVANEHLWARK